MKALDKDGLDYVVDKIYDVVNSGGSADYIVEEGTSGIWTYRKWASGIAECSGIHTYNGTVSAPWGGGYLSATTGQEAFPSGLFLSAPILTMSSNGTQGAFPFCGDATNEVRTGNIFLFRGATMATAQNYSIGINARGFWKTFTPSVMKSATLDTYYPVGSIYISANASFDPNVTFGGTWELMSNNFLVGAGDTYTLGATGGEATHTLTVDEMPSHRHQLTYTNQPVGLNATGSAGIRLSYTSAASTPELYGNSAGGGQAHNNLPPYKAVNMWLRTA